MITQEQYEQKIKIFLSGILVGLVLFLIIMVVVFEIKNFKIYQETNYELIEENEIYEGEVFGKARYNEKWEYLVCLYDVNDKVIIVLSEDAYITIQDYVLIYYDNGTPKLYKGSE